MPSKSPLQVAATQGTDKISERQAKSALGQAVHKIASLTKRADKTKNAVVETGTRVIHTAETQGTLFLASLSEGYFGSERMRVGGLDLRAPAALFAQGFGIYESMSGKGGGHSLAIGNGLMGSWLASVAVQAGQKIKSRSGASPSVGVAGVAPQPGAIAGVPPQPPAPAAPPPLPAPPVELQPSVAGPLREVTLTPEPELVPARNSSGGRFVRARSSN